MFKFAKITCSIIILFLLNACSSASDDSEKTQPNPQINQTTNDNVPNILEKTAPSQQLPFADFKERWNAVCDEQITNLYIQNLEAATNERGSYYHTRIHPQIMLRIFVDNDYVQQLEMISEGKANTTTLAMLAGWSQIINILHPNMEINDVDEFYQKIGVGPNADLTKVKPTSFTYYDLNYQIYTTENGYGFIAAYAKPQ